MGGLESTRKFTRRNATQRDALRRDEAAAVVLALGALNVTGIVVGGG